MVRMQLALLIIDKLAIIMIYGKSLYESSVAKKPISVLAMANNNSLVR
jgi:hypothetical protein